MSAATATTARLQRMDRGSHFRAYSLHGDEAAALIDPFLAVPNLLHPQHRAHHHG